MSFGRYTGLTSPTPTRSASTPEDKVVIAYVYGDLPPGTNEKQPLDKILDNAFARASCIS